MRERCLGGFLDAGLPVDLVVSRAARLTLLDETGVRFRDSHWATDLAAWLDREVADADLVCWPPTDLAAGPSSGSYRTRGMVVVPASTASVAGIAIGLSKDLLQRAADVTLKEGGRWSSFRERRLTPGRRCSTCSSCTMRARSCSRQVPASTAHRPP